MSSITINGITIDPERQGAELRALALESADASSSNYVLIQTSGPITRDQRKQLVDLGAVLLGKVPENTFVARFDFVDLSAIRALPFVTWANTYLRQFKVALELLRAPVGTDLAGLTAATARDADPGEGGQLVDIVFHSDVDPEIIRNTVAQEAGIDAEGVDASEHKIRAYVDSSRLGRLADIDEVRHIEPVPEAEFFDDVAGRIMRADVVHTGNPSFLGTGEIVAVCDSGFDKGSTTDVHGAFTGRVAKLYALGRATANDPHGHGTHVAGSVLGDGVATGHGSVTGTAPAAELVLQSVLDAGGGLGGLPSDLNDLLDPPFVNDGARVHNNSWGSRNTNGRYTQGSREVDEFIWNHREMAVCFAAGNPGRDGNSNGVIDLGSVQAPGTAKNCITVGASENDRPNQSKVWATGSWTFRYPAEPIASDLWADNPDGMAAFSGRGPTTDHRIKPDLVAPGTSILSAHSRDAAVGDFWGTSPDSDWAYMGGTSMATPLVSGSAAVVREFLIAQGFATPSAALVKAALVNGCVELPGQYTPSEAGPVPNFDEGFGRVDLERCVITPPSGVLEYHDEGTELDTGEESQFSVTVPHGVSTLKVTLIWTDPPGEGLQNDLDLVVVASNGDVRHGNMPAGSSGFDRRNNVEQVLWVACPVGTTTIAVRAFDIAIHPQSFALVVRVE